MSLRLDCISCSFSMSEWIITKPYFQLVQHWSFMCLYILILLIFVQFDYLKSLEIEEKINNVRWCATPNGALFILSTNDKTIKLWKVCLVD